MKVDKVASKQPKIPKAQNQALADSIKARLVSDKEQQSTPYLIFDNSNPLPECKKLLCSGGNLSRDILLIFDSFESMRSGLHVTEFLYYFIL